MAEKVQLSPARLTTRCIPGLISFNDNDFLGSSHLSAEAAPKEALQTAALAHISTPAWPSGFWKSRGFRNGRFEVEKVPTRRGLRFLLGGPPVGSSNIVIQADITLESATEPDTLITVRTPQQQEVSDDSAERRLLADRARRHSEEERWSRHSERHFVNENGHRIYTQQWLPKRDSMKAAVVVLHGLNEHSGRYKHLAKQLTKKGYGVFGMDWYGHGRSDGLHGFVDRLDNTVQDAGAFLGMVKQQHPDVPCFFYGHSTGAAIALKAAESAPRNDLAGLVLTAPAIAIEPPHPLLATLLPLVSEVAPTLQVESANRSDVAVSRDPASLVDKYSDPLVYTGSIRIRTGSEVLRIASDVRKNLHTVRHPFLVCHGTDDRVTLPEGSKELYRKAPVAQKKLKLYPGCLHDLLLEPEKDEVVQDVVDWMDGQLELKERTELAADLVVRRANRIVTGGKVSSALVVQC